MNTALNGDFTIDSSIVHGIVGKNKSNAQIQNVENLFIAANNIEAGFFNKIPLWLFGFLY